MQITGLRVDSTSLQPRTWHTPSAPPNRDGAVRESSARRKPSKKGRRGPRRPPPSEALIERPFRSSRSRLPAHSEPPLPRAPLEVAGLAPADWHHAETLRELFLPFRAAVARGRLCRRIHLEDPLIQRRENPDGLSRALRPGVAVGEELLSLVGFRARSTR